MKTMAPPVPAPNADRNRSIIPGDHIELEPATLPDMPGVTAKSADNTVPAILNSTEEETVTSDSQYLQGWRLYCVILR